MDNRRKLYSQNDMEAAVNACKSGAMSQRVAASTFNVPRATLGDKLKGLYPVTPRSRTVLMQEEEARVVEWLEESAARGCGQGREEVCLAIQRILNAEGRDTPFKDNKPGSKWFYSFLTRHPNLKQRKTSIVGEQRAKVSEEKIRTWFREVELNLDQEGINIHTVPPQNIFNVDESGFPFLQRGNVMVTDVNEKHPCSMGSDTKQQITVLCAGSAGGSILSPYIIFPGSRWTYYPWDDFKNAHYDLTSNGRVNSEVFLTWLRNAFEPATRDLSRPVVLFADGHQSLIDMDVHFFCKQHQITYYVLPAHASHVVQPLDLIFYDVLKQQWRDSVNDYKRISNVCAVTKKSFAGVFKEAWIRSHTPEKMAKAFEAAGLSPWNPGRPDYSKCRASRVNGTFPAASSASPEPLSATVGPSVELSPSVCPIDDMSPSVCPSVEQSLSVCPSVEQSPSVCPSVEQSPSVCLSVEQSPSVCPSVVQSPSVCPTDDLSSPVSPSSDLPSTAVDLSNPVVPRTKNIAMAVDQLVDFIITSGWSASDMYSIRRRQWRNIPPGPDEEKYQKYLDLYNDIVPPSAFDNLPLPQKCSAKSAHRVQTPKYVSGEKFREFQERKKKEERDKKAAIETRKRRRARKKAEKEKKRLERETANKVNMTERQAEKEAVKEKKRMEREAKGKANAKKTHKGKGLKKRKTDVINEKEAESDECDSDGIECMDSSGDECAEVLERMLSGVGYDESTYHHVLNCPPRKLQLKIAKVIKSCKKNSKSSKRSCKSFL